MSDCRLFQFPTTPVHTNSQSEANNPVGGWIEIVNHKMAGWVLDDHTNTDPMGLGIINSLDFKADDYKICSINAYFTSTAGTDPATHHTSITSY
jgi:hypothetical protein